jgi:hypothetical protein
LLKIEHCKDFRSHTSIQYIDPTTDEIEQELQQSHILTELRLYFFDFACCKDKFDNKGVKRYYLSRVDDQGEEYSSKRLPDDEVRDYWHPRLVKQENEKAVNSGFKIHVSDYSMLIHRDPAEIYAKLLTRRPA